MLLLAHLLEKKPESCYFHVFGLVVPVHDVDQQDQVFGLVVPGHHVDQQDQLLLAMKAIWIFFFSFRFAFACLPLTFLSAEL